MHFTFALLGISVVAVIQDVFAYKYDRLDKNDSVLLVVDQQIGVFEMVRDYDPVEFKSNVLAHATLGKLFDLPTILTTSSDNGTYFPNSCVYHDTDRVLGPNGPVLKEVMDLHPNAPLIRRDGEVNAWDNADFRAAVKATGKKHVILAGVITDVCTAFLALSLAEEGYIVYANAEASGTYSRRMADYANDRMRAAGVQVVPTIVIVMELMRDWRTTPGFAELSPYIDRIPLLTVSKLTPVTGLSCAAEDHIQSDQTRAVPLPIPAHSPYSYHGEDATRTRDDQPRLGLNGGPSLKGGRQLIKTSTYRTKASPEAHPDSPQLVVAMPSSNKFERLDKNDALLLIVDHQIGLFETVKDFEPVEFRNNILAHAALGKVFGLPAVMTTSTDNGPNGQMLQEVLDMHPDAPLIRREGEVNAWDNKDFRAAVKATGKKQVILAGIVTDVCTAFLALSLIEEGYTVYANADASGTYSKRAADDANARMRAAGVQVVSMFAVAADLMRDWRLTPGLPELGPFFDRYFPVYGMVSRNFITATGGKQN
ncbi:hypothetical protein PQX77_001357 [Marasmius sp. AFHP31]|nr:hypothetical protein PQX77_001357 [Marasmius sp. AFHP31]